MIGIVFMLCTMLVGRIGFVCGVRHIVIYVKLIFELCRLLLRL